jgi:hypothetical protein
MLRCGCAELARLFFPHLAFVDLEVSRDEGVRQLAVLRRERAEGEDPHVRHARRAVETVRRQHFRVRLGGGGGGGVK